VSDELTEAEQLRRVAETGSYGLMVDLLDELVRKNGGSWGAVRTRDLLAIERKVFADAARLRAVEKAAAALVEHYDDPAVCPDGVRAAELLDDLTDALNGDTP